MDQNFSAADMQQLLSSASETNTVGLLQAMNTDQANMTAQNALYNVQSAGTTYCSGCYGYHYSWWPSSWCSHRDKTAEAFKIIQELMKQKLIREIKSVNKFIELVGKISEII